MICNLPLIYALVAVPIEHLAMHWRLPAPEILMLLLFFDPLVVGCRRLARVSILLDGVLGPSAPQVRRLL